MYLHMDNRNIYPWIDETTKVKKEPEENGPNLNSFQRIKTEPKEIVSHLEPQVEPRFESRYELNRELNRELNHEPQIQLHVEFNDKSVKKEPKEPQVKPDIEPSLKLPLKAREIRLLTSDYKQLLNNYCCIK